MCIHPGERAADPLTAVEHHDAWLGVAEKHSGSRTRTNAERAAAPTDGTEVERHAQSQPVSRARAAAMRTGKAPRDAIGALFCQKGKVWHVHVGSTDPDINPPDPGKRSYQFVQSPKP